MRRLLPLALLAVALALLGGLLLPPREELAALLKPAVAELARAPAAATAKAAARKCLDAAGRVLYTTEAACPAGQRERPVQGGSLNVIALPAAPASAPASVAMPLERIDAATRP